MVSAETVDCFKTRLDKFWLNQDNFRSEIHGNKSRSEVAAKFFSIIEILYLVGYRGYCLRLIHSTSAQYVTAVCSRLSFDVIYVTVGGQRNRLGFPLVLRVNFLQLL